MLPVDASTDVLSSYLTENLLQLHCKPNLAQTTHVWKFTSMHVAISSSLEEMNLLKPVSIQLPALQNLPVCQEHWFHTVYQKQQDQSHPDLHKVPVRDVKLLPKSFRSSRPSWNQDRLFACQEQQLARIKSTTMWPMIGSPPPCGKWQIQDQDHCQLHLQQQQAE